MGEDTKALFGAISKGVGIMLVFMLIWMWLSPKYNVWEQGMVGKAAYTRAEQDRKVKVLEAQAKKESARLEAEAEVERARGVAQANEIIAGGLKGNEDYLRYLWITGLEHSDKQVIYIPTEAGLPILEAGKR